MQSRANSALIGLFTIAFVAALFGCAYWFSSGRQDTVNVQLIFNNKISGLGRGSTVLFNGLRVGEVVQIDIQPDNPRQIAAVIKVDRSTPLRVDTSARLEGQGLAGVVAVQLRGGDPRSARLTASAGQSLPVIVAEPSEDIFEKVSSIAKNVDEAVDGIEKAIQDNAGPIGDSINTVEQFSRTLSDSSGRLEKFMKGISDSAEFIAPLPGKLEAFSDDATRAIRSIDREGVGSVIDRVDTYSATLAGAAADVGTTVRNGASMAEKINRAADQVEGVLKGAQSFLKTATDENGRSFFDDVADVAKSMRALAETLDRRTAELTSQISRLTSTGLRDVEAVATDGRRGLSGFVRTLRGVRRDPQSLIFGAQPALPPYRGAR